MKNLIEWINAKSHLMLKKTELVILKSRKRK